VPDGGGVRVVVLSPAAVQLPTTTGGVRSGMTSSQYLNEAGASSQYFSRAVGLQSAAVHNIGPGYHTYVCYLQTLTLASVLYFVK